MSHRAFEEAVGLKKNALKGLLDKSAPRTPSLENAKAIAEAVGLELYLGEPRSTTKSASEDFVRIDRFDVALSAGPGRAGDNARQLAPVAFRLDWMSRMGLNARDCVVVAVSGDSIEVACSAGKSRASA